MLQCSAAKTRTMRALLIALALHNTKALSTATLTPPKLATASTPTLALPFAELSELVGGKGRARSIWDAVRSGQEPLDADDEKQRRDREHAERVEAKRKECEARTAKNAAKRRKKKEAKQKRDAIAKGTGGTHAFEDDGSFMAKAKALVKEKE